MLIAVRRSVVVAVSLIAITQIVAGPIALALPASPPFRYPAATATVPGSTDSTVPTTAGDGRAGGDTTVPDTTVPDTTVAFQAPPLLASDSVQSEPLIVVPSGCAAAPPALAVFEGVAKAATADSVQFEILQVRAGSLDGWATAGRRSRINIFYGRDARFLEIDRPYLVGVAREPSRDLLVSQVREAAAMFGGDAVIGIDESDVECPRIDVQVLTLTTDGQRVDAGLLSGLSGSGQSMVEAFVRPAVIAFAVLLLLVTIKHLLFAFARSIRDIEVAPRVERTRRHGADPDEPDLQG